MKTGLHIQLIVSSTLMWAVGATLCSFAYELPLNDTSDKVIDFSNAFYFKALSVWAFLVSTLFYRYTHLYKALEVSAVLSAVSYLGLSNVIDEFFIEDPSIATKNEYLWALAGVASAFFEYYDFHPLRAIYNNLCLRLAR